MSLFKCVVVVDFFKRNRLIIKLSGYPWEAVNEYFNNEFSDMY